MDCIPDDLLRKVFSLLTSKDLCTVNQVCRKWRIISNDPYLWKSLVCPCSSAAKLRLCLSTRLNKLTSSLTICPGAINNTGSFRSVFTSNNVKILNDLGRNITKLDIRCQHLSPEKSNPWCFANNSIFPPENVEDMTLGNMECCLVDYGNERFSKLHSLSIIRGYTNLKSLLTLKKLRFLRNLRLNGNNLNMRSVVQAVLNLKNRITLLDLSETCLTDEHLWSLLAGLLFLKDLSVNRCNYISENSFRKFSENNSSDACRSLRVIKASFTSLNGDSLPAEWTARGILLVV